MASPSNIALDGRLLDFTSVAWLLRKLTDGAAYDAGLVQMMSEHYSLLRNLDSIGVHVDKYCFQRQDKTLRGELAMTFNYHFTHALALGYLQALGIPGTVANALMAQPTLLPLVNAYVAAIRIADSAFWASSAGLPLLTHFYLREFFTNDGTPMAPAAQAYVAGSTLFALLRGLLPAVRRACAQLGLVPLSVQTALIFVSCRRLTVTPVLSDTALRAAIAAMASSRSGPHGALAAHLAELRNEARFCFGRDFGLEVLPAADAHQEIHWLLDGHGLHVRRGTERYVFRSLTDLAAADPEGARLLAARYPDRLLQLLNTTGRERQSPP